MVSSGGIAIISSCIGLHIYGFVFPTYSSTTRFGWVSTFYLYLGLNALYSEHFGKYVQPHLSHFAAAGAPEFKSAANKPRLFMELTFLPRSKNVKAVGTCFGRVLILVDASMVHNSYVTFPRVTF